MIARGSVECSRAAVIAEALPGVQDVGFVGLCQAFEVRKACDEGAETATDGGNRGLLQHQLADQDLIGIDGHAGQGAPGEMATMVIIPGEQRPAERACSITFRLDGR